MFIGPMEEDTAAILKQHVKMQNLEVLSFMDDTKIYMHIILP